MPAVDQEPLPVTDADYCRKLDELDRLLNDPDIRLEPARVWALLAEVSCMSPQSGTPGSPPAR
jgi:hypothetical protein